MLKIDAYSYLEASAVLQLSFCVRWSLRPEWDFDKIAIVHRNMGLPKRWQSRIMGFAMSELENRSTNIEKAIKKLPPQYHEVVYLHCARIVALKGFEEDINSLVTLKGKLFISNSSADLLIDLAKQEAELIRLGLLL